MRRIFSSRAVPPSVECATFDPSTIANRDFLVMVPGNAGLVPRRKGVAGRSGQTAKTSDVRIQNTEFRQTTASQFGFREALLNSEFCILTSDVFAVPLITSTTSTTST